MRPAESDLAEIAALADQDCRWLAGKRILLTGGTGFIGTWFLALFDHLNRERAAGIFCAVPSRNPEAFLARNDHLRQPWLSVFSGDIRTFSFPEGAFDLVIHGATDVGNAERAQDYRTTFEVCVEGTKRVLEFVKAKKVSHLLLLSSGAVYGRQDPAVAFLEETSPCTIDPTLDGSAYGEGKRVAEWLVAHHARAEGFHAGIARCFAFSGAGLPLDGPFALGNFLADSHSGRAISVKSDGSALRSYLYASDLIVWLLAILHRGQSGSPYNVGSDHAVSIRQLAEAISQLPQPAVPVSFLAAPMAGVLPARYVPSVQKAIRDLGVSVAVPFHDGLLRHWNSLQGES